MWILILKIKFGLLWFRSLQDNSSHTENLKGENTCTNDECSSYMWCDISSSMCLLTEGNLQDL
jgi:hypothetical protein